MAEVSKQECCGCMCDPTVSRVLEQSAARYNDRSSYANNNQQDNQTLLLSMFQAQAQQALESTPTSNLANDLAMLMALMGRGPAAGT